MILLVFLFDVSSWDYFLNRIDFAETKNLSALVFLSGWERAFLNLKDTFFYGVGFQQFGIVGELGSYQKILGSLGFEKLNLYDGRSTGSKLIGELGILGIALISIYLIYFIKIFLTLKKIINKNTSLQFVFFASIFLMSSVEFFIRGVGYFSPTMFLFFASIMFFMKKNILRGAKIVI